LQDFKIHLIVNPVNPQILKTLIKDPVHPAIKPSSHPFDIWVEKVGKWFETGALGPGTVTFKDKTFTAQ
jgi:hypothetical protein